MFLVKIVNYYEIDEGYDEIEFLIDESELLSYDILYEKYLLSRLMTKDIENLVRTSNGWGVYNLKNWKGLYFTKNYEISYHFAEKPTMKEPEKNEENLKKFIKTHYDDKDKYETMKYQNMEAFKRFG